MGGPGRGMVRISSAHTRLFVSGAFVLSSCERSLGSSTWVEGKEGGGWFKLVGCVAMPSAHLQKVEAESRRHHAGWWRENRLESLVSNS